MSRLLSKTTDSLHTHTWEAVPSLNTVPWYVMSWLVSYLAANVLYVIIWKNTKHERSMTIFQNAEGWMLTKSLVFYWDVTTLEELAAFSFPTFWIYRIDLDSNKNLNQRAILTKGLYAMGYFLPRTHSEQHIIETFLNREHLRLVYTHITNCL